jgi:putative transcriptional regulator
VDRQGKQGDGCSENKKAHGEPLAQDGVEKKLTRHQAFVMAGELCRRCPELGICLADAYNKGMTSLEGQFLVAMPDMADERFAESVILVVGHGEEGAMGLVINHQLAEMRFSDILDELDLGDPDAVIRLPDSIRERAVMRGGPVEKSRGFVLHSPDYKSGNTYAVNEGICLTATVDILKAMAFGPAPRSALFALGCCGWSAGQLESEIVDNGWLTVPFSRELLFDTPVEDRYDAALASLHITRATLSPDAGHA